MKQITLENYFYAEAPTCPGRIAVTWGLYGFAIALLWQMAGGSALGQAATWVAAAAGAALLLGMGAI